MKKSKGFTLIELLAVIVILAIIALIATPMVLKYIEKSKEGSNDVSVDSILRAADNYYAASLLDKKTTYPKIIYLPDSSNVLGIKGRQPDMGQVTINADGTTIIEVIYDGIVYTKYENETTISKNNMVIGDASLWTTKEGVITSYNVNNANDLQAAVELNFDSFIKYLIVSFQYASNNGLGTQNIAQLTEIIGNANTLEEVISQAETILGIDRSGLPLSLNQELDKIINNYLKDKSSYNEAVSIIAANASSIPHSADAFDRYSKNDTSYSSYSAYSQIVLYVLNSNKVVIPNFVKHADGSLERILEIGDGTNSINKGSAFGNVVISYGIQKINNSALGSCSITSVVIPSSVETIGAYSFTFNAIENVVLPNKVDELGAFAFAGNRIKNLIIPGTVKKINNNCFAGNEIQTLTLSEGLEEIGIQVFYNNQFTEVTLPLSVKKIGEDAFTSASLKKVYRYRDASYSAATRAFGNPGDVTFEYID